MMLIKFAGANWVTVKTFVILFDEIEECFGVVWMDIA
jgi:hypothetical protein